MRARQRRPQAGRVRGCFGGKVLGPSASLSAHAKLYNSPVTEKQEECLGEEFDINISATYKLKAH